MRNWAAQKAEYVCQKYGASSLDFILGKLKLSLFEVPITSRIKEAYFRDLSAIAVGPDLHWYQKRHFILHAIAHHLLHKHSRANYFLDDNEDLLNKLRIWQKEKEAEIFAAYFLIPEDRLSSLLTEDWLINSENPILSLAEEFQVPPELMKKRLEFREQLGY